MIAAMRALVLAVVVVLAACGDGVTAPDDIAFDLDGALDTPATFWDLPFPSDLRTTTDGVPDMAGHPNPARSRIVDALLLLASERRGASTIPVVFVRFREPPPRRSPDDIIAATAGADALLVDIDPASPERGRLVPLVAKTLATDDYAPPALVAFAPRPGFVLAAATRHALVVRRRFAPGAEPPAAFAALARGDTPDGERGAAAAALHAPLWDTLDAVGVDRDDVLVAAVFTTGDEAAVLRARSEAVRAAHDAVLGPLAVDPVDGAGHDGVCELVGTVTLPQFQVGAPPFDRDGRFVLDGAGAPIAQGAATVPLVVTLPVGEMPAAGWPLYLFFHGSGGVSSGVIDLGPTPVRGAVPIAGQGPGFVVARHGIAAASSALPLNPERMPGASDYAYLNIDNLSAFPYTFQQGVLEQRLLLDALLALRIEPATVAACAGVTLPAGETAHRFDPDKLVAGGQSMGGVYTNMVGAVEPRLGALVPTGAGGLWNAMILDSAIVPGSRSLLAGLFDTPEAEISFLHPGMALLDLAWEIAEPMASMARLAERPLPDLPRRHIYEPIGLDDEYFPTTIFDAAALAYGNQQAGDALWPGTQQALALDDRGGLLAYPVRGNRDGRTAVTVQVASDGIENAHYAYRQLETVKHQYGCFLRTYLDDGVPTVVAPAPLATPCR
jgi:hypothetical protein